MLVSNGSDLSKPTKRIDKAARIPRWMQGRAGRGVVEDRQESEEWEDINHVPRVESLAFEIEPEVGKKSLTALLGGQNDNQSRRRKNSTRSIDDLREQSRHRNDT